MRKEEEEDEKKKKKKKKKEEEEEEKKKKTMMMMMTTTMKKTTSSPDRADRQRQGEETDRDQRLQSHPWASAEMQKRRTTEAVSNTFGQSKVEGCFTPYSVKESLYTVVLPSLTYSQDL